MANPRIPDDPYISPNNPNRSVDAAYRTNLGDDELSRASRIDNQLQMDPELAEGPASGGRVAIFAVAIAVVLGAVFFGLNHSTIDRPGTSSTAQNAQPSSSPPAAPPGMRDVTPRANTEPGVTTGAAPAQPQKPPAAAPTGADLNRSGNPPATTPPNTK